MFCIRFWILTYYWFLKASVFPKKLLYKAKATQEQAACAALLPRAPKCTGRQLGNKYLTPAEKIHTGVIPSSVAAKELFCN